MANEFTEYYEVMDRIDELMKLDPEPDSVEGCELLSKVTWVQRFEGRHIYLPEKLNIERAKRAKAFVENEFANGRPGFSKDVLLSQLMRFAELEEATQ